MHLRNHPYIMDLSFCKYDFQKNGDQITGYSISEISNNQLSTYIQKMGLSESSLNTITKPLRHCKVPCGSPC